MTASNDFDPVPHEPSLFSARLTPHRSLNRTGFLVLMGFLSVVSFAAGLFVDPAPGPVLANSGLDNLRFLTPTYPGDELTITLTAKAITPRAGDYGEVRWDADLTKQDGTSVAKYDVLTMVAKKWPMPSATEGVN